MSTEQTVQQICLEENIFVPLGYAQMQAQSLHISVKYVDDWHIHCFRHSGYILKSNHSWGFLHIYFCKHTYRLSGELILYKSDLLLLFSNSSETPEVTITSLCKSLVSKHFSHLLSHYIFPKI